jgi:hypothetical protein
LDAPITAVLLVATVAPAPMAMALLMVVVFGTDESREANAPKKTQAVSVTLAALPPLAPKPACHPRATLLEPVVTKTSALSPTAVFCDPLVWVAKLAFPTAVLPPPVET